MAGGVKKRSKSQGSTEDMISNLPDPLLHHIFSFLTMEDVVKTSLLSKRWKYLWTSLSVLNYPYFCRHSDAAAIIGTTLLRNERIKIQRLSIDLDPHVRACHSHIDSWIDFAMRRNVEELHIKLKFEEENRYKAPRFLLDCGTLRVFKLRHVDLPLPVYFHFCLLTKLDISQANLTHLDTSHCPLLEGLIIRCCNRNINIYAPNRKLRYLKIVEAFDNDCGLTLYAPHLSSIEFRSSLRQFYTFQDLSSLRTATLLFMDDSNSDCTYTTVILKLLKDLRHAEVLKLGNSCIKTLGWVETSPLETHLSATYLQLATNLDRWELAGFAYLLKSCPCLESLSIDIRSSSNELKTAFWYANDDDYDIDKSEFFFWGGYDDYEINESEFLFWGGYDNSDIDESKIWEHLGIALSASLNLRTVTIHNFLGRYSDWVFDDEDEDIKLVRLMLKQCKVLGKMTVVTSLDPKRALESKLLHTMMEKLLAFPRGSETAEIYISYRS